jgi:hypothetical protein
MLWRLAKLSRRDLHRNTGLQTLSKSAIYGTQIVCPASGFGGVQLRRPHRLQACVPNVARDRATPEMLYFTFAGAIARKIKLPNQ